MWFLLAIPVLAAAYVLATCCRKGHPGLSDLQGWRYAHRGLHGAGVPENSMAAFRKALDMGYGMELDVHLLKDGSLAVLHDHSLKRTANADVSIEDLTADQLKNPKDISYQRIYDRILERCHPVEVTGQSRRRKALINTHADVQAMLELD